MDLLLSSGPVHKLLPSSTSIEWEPKEWKEKKASHLHDADLPSSGQSVQRISEVLGTTAQILCQEMFSLPSAFCAPNIFKHFLCHLHERWWNSAITHDSWHWKYRGMLICMLRFMQSSFECVRGQSRTQRWCKDETRAKTENPPATRRLCNGDWCFWHRCKARLRALFGKIFSYWQNLKFPTRLTR